MAIWELWARFRSELDEWEAIRQSVKQAKASFAAQVRAGIVGGRPELLVFQATAVASSINFGYSGTPIIAIGSLRRAASK